MQRDECVSPEVKLNDEKRGVSPLYARCLKSVSIMTFPTEMDLSRIHSFAQEVLIGVTTRGEQPIRETVRNNSVPPLQASFDRNFESPASTCATRITSFAPTRVHAIVS